MDSTIHLFRVTTKLSQNNQFDSFSTWKTSTKSMAQSSRFQKNCAYGGRCLFVRNLSFFTREPFEFD
jgi:hypothetical protein